jgi:hypothetical protein
LAGSLPNSRRSRIARYRKHAARIIFIAAAHPAPGTRYPQTPGTRHPIRSAYFNAASAFLASSFAGLIRRAS